MLANNWYDQSIQFEAIDGRRGPIREDNDEALDDWLASLSVNQFARVLDFLLGEGHDRRLERSA